MKFLFLIMSCAFPILLSCASAPNRMVAGKKVDNRDLGKFVEEGILFEKDVEPFLNELSKLTSGAISNNASNWESNKIILIYEAPNFDIQIFNETTHQMLVTVPAKSRTDDNSLFLSYLNKAHPASALRIGMQRPNYEVHCRLVIPPDHGGETHSACLSKLYFRSPKMPGLE